MNEITESQAVADTVKKIIWFKQKHGGNALKDALQNGAFLVHPNYGDLTYILVHRDFDPLDHTVPLWISDLFKEEVED